MQKRIISILLERENLFPIILYADDGPVLVLGLGQQSVAERAKLHLHAVAAHRRIGKIPERFSSGKHLESSGLSFLANGRDKQIVERLLPHQLRRRVAKNIFHIRTRVSKKPVRIHLPNEVRNCLGHLTLALAQRAGNCSFGEAFFAGDEFKPLQRADVSRRHIRTGITRNTNRAKRANPMRPKGLQRSRSL